MDGNAGPSCPVETMRGFVEGFPYFSGRHWYTHETRHIIRVFAAAARAMHEDAQRHHDRLLDAHESLHPVLKKAKRLLGWNPSRVPSTSELPKDMAVTCRGLADFVVSSPGLDTGGADKRPLIHKPLRVAAVLDRAARRDI